VGKLIIVQQRRRSALIGKREPIARSLLEKVRASDDAPRQLSLDTHTPIQRSRFTQCSTIRDKARFLRRSGWSHTIRLVESVGTRSSKCGREILKLRVLIVKPDSGRNFRWAVTLCWRIDNRNARRNKRSPDNRVPIETQPRLDQQILFHLPLVFEICSDLIIVNPERCCRGKH